MTLVGKPQNLITMDMPRTASQSLHQLLSLVISQGRKDWVDVLTAVCFSRLPPTPSFQEGPGISVFQRLFPLVATFLTWGSDMEDAAILCSPKKCLFPWRYTSSKPPYCVTFHGPIRGMIFILSVVSSYIWSQSRDLTYSFKWTSTCSNKGSWTLIRSHEVSREFHCINLFY